MARILLSAYACEPGRGSEPAVGWSWATELARQGHQVTVVTRTANRLAIARENRPQSSGTSFIFYDLPRWVQRLRRWPGGKRAYYVLWQWFAARTLRRRFLSLPFDAAQHVTYVSVRYPSFMGSLGIPFYFGPVSGGEAVPQRLRRGSSAAECCREWLRDISNRLVCVDPLMRRTFRQATRILVTPDTLPLLPRHVLHKTAQTLAIGLPSRAPVNSAALIRPRGLRLLYVGRLLQWKGIDIALRAVSLARQKCSEVSFTIVGDGPDRARLERLCRQLQLENAVHWAGWLPQAKVALCYRGADALLFPSLRDSGGMVVLEALAHGVPVLCTDLGGPGLIVNSSCGRRLATEARTRAELAGAFGEAILELAPSASLLHSLRHGAKLRARDFTFAALVQSVYSGPVTSAMENPA
jgi:glycosyltransferase involved in cell wall biosynthesis